MIVEPKNLENELKVKTKELSCMFCGHILDFVISESYGVGLNFKCSKCKKNFFITES